MSAAPAIFSVARALPGRRSRAPTGRGAQVLPVGRPGLLEKLRGPAGLAYFNGRPGRRIVAYLQGLSDRMDEFGRLEALQHEILAEIGQFRGADRLGRDEVHDRAVR